MGSLYLMVVADIESTLLTETRRKECNKDQIAFPAVYTFSGSKLLTHVSPLAPQPLKCTVQWTITHKAVSIGYTDISGTEPLLLDAVPRTDSKVSSNDSTE